MNTHIDPLSSFNALDQVIREAEGLAEKAAADTHDSSFEAASSIDIFKNDRIKENRRLTELLVAAMRWSSVWTKHKNDLIEMLASQMRPGHPSQLCIAYMDDAKEPAELVISSRTRRTWDQNKLAALRGVLDHPPPWCTPEVKYVVDIERLKQEPIDTYRKWMDASELKPIKPTVTTRSAVVNP